MLVVPELYMTFYNDVLYLSHVYLSAEQNHWLLNCTSFLPEKGQR